METTLTRKQIDPFTRRKNFDQTEKKDNSLVIKSQVKYPFYWAFVRSLESLQQGQPNNETVNKWSFEEGKC